MFDRCIGHRIAEQEIDSTEISRGPQRQLFRPCLAAVFRSDCSSSVRLFIGCGKASHTWAGRVILHCVMPDPWPPVLTVSSCRLQQERMERVARADKRG